MNQTGKPPKELARVLHDTSDEYFTHRVNNCTDKRTLRECLKYEAEHECRQDRIAALNAQVQRL